MRVFLILFVLPAFCIVAHAKANYNYELGDSSIEDTFVDRVGEDGQLPQLRFERQKQLNDQTPTISTVIKGTTAPPNTVPPTLKVDPNPTISEVPLIKTQNRPEEVPQSYEPSIEGLAAKTTASVPVPLPAVPQQQQNSPSKSIDDTNMIDTLGMASPNQNPSTPSPVQSSLVQDPTQPLSPTSQTPRLLNADPQDNEIPNEKLVKVRPSFTAENGFESQDKPEEGFPIRLEPVLGSSLLEKKQLDSFFPPDSAAKVDLLFDQPFVPQSKPLPIVQQNPEAPTADRADVSQVNARLSPLTDSKQETVDSIFELDVADIVKDISEVLKSVDLSSEETTVSMPFRIPSLFPTKKQLGRPEDSGKASSRCKNIVCKMPKPDLKCRLLQSDDGVSLNMPLKKPMEACCPLWTCVNPQGRLFTLYQDIAQNLVSVSQKCEEKERESQNPFMLPRSSFPRIPMIGGLDHVHKPLRAIPASPFTSFFPFVTPMKPMAPVTTFHSASDKNHHKHGFCPLSMKLPHRSERPGSFSFFPLEPRQVPRNNKAKQLPPIFQALSPVFNAMEDVANDIVSSTLPLLLEKPSHPHADLQSRPEAQQEVTFTF